MSEAILRIENLSITDRTTGKCLLSDLTWTIPEATLMALIGQSGAGKSLVCLAVMGLLPKHIYISAGHIIYRGQNITAMDEREWESLRGLEIGMIFQDAMTSLNPIRTIGAQVMDLLRQRLAYRKPQAKVRAQYLLDKVGISPHESFNRYPFQFSGGQQQRILIAMALACKPKLLIADEPTTSLDPIAQKHIMDLFRAIKEEFGTSIIMVSHDLILLSHIADRVLILQQGCKVEAGLIADILKHPRQDYTRELLACRPPRTFRPKRLASLGSYGKGETIPVIPRLPKKQAKEVLLACDDLCLTLGERRRWGGPQADGFSLQNISLKVYKGQTLGVVGRSGSGKTTLGRIIGGIQKHDRGRIYYLGKDLRSMDRTQLRQTRKSIQYVFQNSYSTLNPHLTVQQLLQETMDIYGLRDSGSLALLETLNLVELSAAVLHKFPYQLSGGERQRVNIARILVVQPELIIFDESVSALDVSVQARILNLLLDIQDALNLSYLFISHDISVVTFMAHDVLVMDQGRVVETIGGNVFYQQAKSEVSEQLIEAMPSEEYFDLDIYKGVYDLSSLR